MQVLEGGPGQEGGGKAKWVCLAPGRKPLRGSGLIVCVCVCVCVFLHLAINMSTYMPSRSCSLSIGPMDVATPGHLELST